MARKLPEVNSAPMADIAFLLLIFFLVTTTIASDKGILMLLPPDVEVEDVDIHDRNIYKILINSSDRIMIEGEEVTEVTEIRGMVKEFVLNFGKNPNLSDSPKDGIISLKADRGTSYDVFIQVLDELHGAYNDIWGSKFGLTGVDFLKLDRKNPEIKTKMDKVKAAVPKNISIAEPTKHGE